jgi:hypothetical protein
VKLYSRPGNDLTDRFPLIVEALAGLRSRSCIIDGEAVACDDRGIASFDLIRHHRNDDRVFLYGFDLIELNGDDLRRDPLQVRKVTLTSVLAKAGAGIRFNSTWKATVKTVFRHACKPRARIHRLEAEGFRLNTGHCLGIPVKSAAGAQRRLIPLRGGQVATCTSSSNPARYRYRGTDCLQPRSVRCHFERRC